MGNDDARREENAAKLREMLAWDGDAEVYLQHLADDVTYTAPYYDGFGVRASKAEVASMVGAVQDMFATVKYEVVDVTTTTDPDYLIAEVQGRNVIKSTGLPYENYYLMMVRFRDGKVVEWREFSNPLVMSRARGE
jgi:ketosteroid isomerase-like protein